MNKIQYQSELNRTWIDMITWRNNSEVRILNSLRFKMLCVTAGEIRQEINEYRKILKLTNDGLLKERISNDTLHGLLRRKHYAEASLKTLHGDLNDIIRELGSKQFHNGS